MRASLRRFFPQHQGSEGDRPDLLRVSLYEDAIPRVPPTPGLKPLHGTVPDYLRDHTKQHRRPKSMPPGNVAATDSTGNHSATALSPPAVPSGPITKDWATPSKSTTALGQDSSSRIDQTQQTSEWPLNSRDGNQMDQLVSASVASSSNERRDWSASESSIPRSDHRIDSGIAHSTLQGYGPQPSYNGESSRVSSLGAMYGEDIADRNIAERERGYDINIATSGLNADMNDPRSANMDSGDGSRGQPRRVSPYSSAQIYGSSDAVQLKPEERGQQPRRKWTVSRKPVGSGPSESIKPLRDTGRDTLSPNQASGKPLRQESHRTNRNSFRTTEPFASRGAYPEQGLNNSQYQDDNPRYASQDVNSHMRADNSRGLTTQGPYLTRKHSSTAVDDLERKLGTMGVVDLHDSTDTTVHETVAPAVVHETVNSKVHEIRQEVVYRDIHEHNFVHRVQPIIDVEVLPAKHYIPTEADGLVEVHPDSVPGRHNHFQIVETVSRDPPVKLGPRQTEPFVEKSVTYRTNEGFDRTESVIRHPRIMQEGAMETGQSWPFPIDSGTPEPYGIAPARVPRRRSSLKRDQAPRDGAAPSTDPVHAKQQQQQQQQQQQPQWM